MVPQRQRRHAQCGRGRREVVGGNAAVEDLGLAVDRHDLFLGQFLEDVAQAEHDHLVAYDQHALVGILQVDRVERRAQPQDDVGPALPAGRAVVEFAHLSAMRRLARELLADTAPGEPVEDAELALAQALVEHGRLGPAGEPTGGAYRLGGLARADVGRGQ